MTSTSCPSPSDLRSAVGDVPVLIGNTLAGEYAVLLRNVARRVGPVVALLDVHVWPHAELETLTRYLRTTVLRQVSDEETLLYPPDPSAPPFAELTADHVRLHTLHAQCEAALTDPCGPSVLRALLGDLLTTLERHLLAEQVVLAALEGSGDDTDIPVLLWLDAWPDELAEERCIERLLRLRGGQTAEVHSHDARRLGDIGGWLHRFDSVGYGLSYVVTDHEDAVLQVTRRQEA